MFTMCYFQDGFKLCDAWVDGFLCLVFPRFTHRKNYSLNICDQNTEVGISIKLNINVAHNLLQLLRIRII
jgi:hypothetical protein